MKHLKSKLILIFLILITVTTSCKNNDTKSEDTKTTKTDDSKIKFEIIKGTKDTLQKDNCIIESNFLLPYAKKTDIKKVAYNNLKCNIRGVEELLCGEKNLRYISLPSFKNIKVILVPMDCGDFNYRYFLVTIFQNKVVSKQYVEGEWYEPGDDSYKEVTSFTIDEDYTITITTNAIESGQSSIKENLRFEIFEHGVLKRIN
ncbi:MAG: hypothetical protein ABI549_02535 [Flavobacterium sp.]|uniref:hypothetical protein n=1 Tax=Flavobacterium sp. TaxID=239 RepID=UPI003263B71F